MLALARLATALLLVATMATGLSAQQAKPADIAKRRAELEKWLDAYRAGDRDVVAREVRGPLSSLTRAAMHALLGDPNARWHPARAAFALEVAVALRRFPSFDMYTAIRDGRGILTGRPAVIGTNSAEDRFEVLWHHMALAVLEGAGNWSAHNEYLVATESRLAKLETLPPSIPIRWPLMRAMNLAVRCCASMTSGDAQQPSVRVISRGSFGSGRSPTPTPPPPTIGDAVALFEKAAEMPALRAEALVREANLQLGFSRVTAGLAALDRAGPINDKFIEYPYALIRASLLDRQGQAEAAADSYRAATKLGPGAQIPAIGLAAALMRAGRLDEAVAAADRARRIPIDGDDPWPTFMHADARFIDGWLTALRAALGELPK